MKDIESLKNQILLEGLNSDELKIIQGLVKKVTKVAGLPIFSEGEPTLGIYMIISGFIEIKRKLEVDAKQKMLIMLRNIHSTEIRLTNDGWEHVFTSLDANDFFGELSIVEGKKKHGALAIAVKDTDLFLLETDTINELEKTHPVIMGKIMRTIAKVASSDVRELDKRLYHALVGN
ncbi:MAG: cyclic nucleotide-binding domain-containing protein [Nitrospirae bacterium]|nr:cyclic nucleotide-binding domain-containing protein [Nitrospirota bacterium]